MIENAHTQTYAQPVVPLTEREHLLHVHYASNALAVGHEPECERVTTARNWPQMFGRPRCSCGAERPS